MNQMIEYIAQKQITWDISCSTKNIRAEYRPATYTDTNCILNPVVLLPTILISLENGNSSLK